MPEQVAHFTAPLGTTIGMPGCAGIWPIAVAVFGINALGIDYGAGDYILLAALCLVVSLCTNVTYPELKHVLGSPGDHVVFFGGTWCHNTRAVIKDVNDQTVASGTGTVYVFHNRLDGQSVGNLHIRETSSSLSYLYGDLVRTYLPDLVTQFMPASNGVTYHPGGDTSASPLGAKKLRVPYVLEFSNGRTVDGVAAPIRRQWIRDNGDGTYREYMTEWRYRNHLPGGLSNEASIASQFAFADEVVTKLVRLFGAVKADRMPASQAAPAPGSAAPPTPAPAPAPTPVPPVSNPVVTTTRLSLSQARPTYGTQVRATVVVSGGAAGKVTVRDGTRVLATVSAPASGRAVATLPARLAVGKHAVVAKFTPTNGAQARQSTSARTTITVKKAKGSTQVKVVKRATSTKRGSLRITVTAKGSSARAGGSYVVKVRGSVVAKGKLANGTATARLPRLTTGKHVVTVTYKGSPQVAKANRSITVAIR